MPNITGCVPFFGLGQVKNLPPRGEQHVSCRTLLAAYPFSDSNIMPGSGHLLRVGKELRPRFRTPESEKSCVPFFGPVFRRT